MANEGQNQGDSQQSRGGAKTEPEEPIYEASYLQTNARSLLKASPSLVAGALAGAKGNRKNFTLEQARNLLSEHRKRKVAYVSVDAEDEA